MGSSGTLLFVALTRPQMFAGVTYSLFRRQCRDRDRIVPDLQVALGACARRCSSTCVGVLLCLREPRFFDLWLTRVCRMSARQELSGLAMQLLPRPDPRRRRPPRARSRPAGICLMRAMSTITRSRLATAC